MEKVLAETKSIKFLITKLNIFINTRGNISYNKVFFIIKLNIFIEI
jgi:hypothetical protein